MKDMSAVIDTTKKVDWSKVISETGLVFGDKLTVLVKGKATSVTYVRPGVVQKSGSIYYIQDATSAEWLYCFPERLEKLVNNPEVDLANYAGRATKAAIRIAAKTHKSEQYKEAMEKKRQEGIARAQRIANAASAISAIPTVQVTTTPPSTPTVQVPPTTAENTAEPKSGLKSEQKSEQKPAAKVAVKK